MKLQTGAGLVHSFEINDGLSLRRYRQGVPSEQVVIEGSVSGRVEVDQLVEALQEWAEDPAGFWEVGP